MVRGATLKDVAIAAEVSIASASRAINGLDNVAEGVRTRVLEAAARLRYVPHGGARSLATKRTNTIAVLLPDIFGEFFSELIRGIDVCARAKGLHILVSGSHGDLNEAIGAARAVMGRVDGLLVMFPFLESTDLAQALPINLPVVALSSRLSETTISAISVDNYEGAVLAVQHLIEQGKRHIAHISGPEGNFEAFERKRGYLDVMKQNGLEPILAPGDFTEASGALAMSQWLLEGAHKIEAVFAANDMMAIGAMMTLRDKGLSVPSDMLMVGFDDIPIARLTAPSLSSIKVGIYELGHKALELLFEALEQQEAFVPKTLILKPQLIVRESSRSPLA